MCGPATLKAPPPALTVALELWLSPQSIVAEKSETGAPGLASLKIATVPLNPWGLVAVTPLALSGASATCAVAWAVAVLNGLS